MNNKYRIFIFVIMLLLLIACSTTTTESETETLWAREFEHRRFFWIGNYDEIINLEVYVDDNDNQNNTIGITYYGEAYLDTNDNNIPDDTTNPINYKLGYFTLQTKGSSDFYLFDSSNNIIELNYCLPVYYVLGVRYKSIIGSDTIEIGSLQNDTIQLKLICPEQLDTTSYTWNYAMKNYYQILSPGSRLDSLSIYYITSGNEHKDKQNDTTYIELLGLDQNHDGLVDENTAFLSNRGLLRFPNREPFADSSILDDPDPVIYTNPYMTGNGKYYLLIFYSETDTLD